MIHEPVKSKIWVGTLDKCLYIIDIQTRSFERKLDAHSDIVICIEIISSQKYFIFISFYLQTFKKIIFSAVYSQQHPVEKLYSGIQQNLKP
jgi:hypothetical protein